MEGCSVLVRDRKVTDGRNPMLSRGALWAQREQLSDLRREAPLGLPSHHGILRLLRGAPA